MTAKEFKKYEGKRTTGRVDGCDLRGGIIIGYTDWAQKAIIPDKEHEKDYINGKKNYLWVTVDNVIMDEQKELDLTKILRGCEGVELFSEVFGVGEIHNVDDFVCVKSKKGYLHYFNYNGRLKQYPDGNCLLWPSETNRDWSTFKKPLKADDWVVACDGEGCGHINKYCNINRTWKYVIPFEKYNPNLTKEELKKLSIV